MKSLANIVPSAPARLETECIRTRLEEIGVGQNSSGSDFPVASVYSKPLDERAVLGHIHIRAIRDSSAWAREYLDGAYSLDAVISAFFSAPLIEPTLDMVDVYSESDLDAGSRRLVSISQPPFIAISEREWWCVKASRRSDGNYELFEQILPAPTPADEARRRVRQDTVTVASSLSLLHAAAELRDARVMFGVILIAVQTSMRAGRFIELGEALEPLIPMLLDPAFAHDVGVISTYCGEAFEAASAKATSGQQRLTKRAAQVYAGAAMLMLGPSGVHVCSGHGEFMWNCLGVCLKGAGEFDQALEAYRWGLSWGICCGRSGAEERQLILKNMQVLERARGRSRSSLKKLSAELALQHAQNVGSRVKGRALCSMCDKTGDDSKMLCCPACRCVTYCDRNCLQGHWAEHMESCKLACGKATAAARLSPQANAIAKADAARERGNVHIRAGRNGGAVQAYNEAISLLGPFESDSSATWMLVKALSNRAEANLRLSHFHAALDDCMDALGLMDRFSCVFDPTESVALRAKVGGRETAAMEAAMTDQSRAEVKAISDRKAAEERAEKSRQVQEKADLRRAEAARKAAEKAEARAAVDISATSERTKRDAENQCAEQEAAALKAEQARAEAAARDARARAEAEQNAIEARRAEESMLAARAARERLLARRREQRQQRADRIESERQAAEAARASELERVMSTVRLAEERQAAAEREAREQEMLEYAIEISEREARIEAQKDWAMAKAGASTSSAGLCLEAEVCSICLEGSDVAPLQHPCGCHPLHLGCAMDWRNTMRQKGLEPTCPECRELI